MNREPIFIVGVQRSGTTLLAAMLAAHSRISCGPETHFFRKLAGAHLPDLTDPRFWPGPATTFICAINHSNFIGGDPTFVIDKYGLKRSEVEAFLRQRPPSIAAMLAALTEQLMSRMGKLRWAEKTPDHLQHLPQIRESYPRAPIIHIVRDPRDVALSLGKVPWGVKSFAEGLLYWDRLHAPGQQFLVDDDSSYTLRFEDLLASPQETLKRLCAFLGEEFEVGMLDTSTTGKQVNSQSVPWKQKAGEPIDTGRMYTWRNELTASQNQLAEAFIGDWLNTYGYPRDTSFTRLGEIYPAASITKYSTALESIAAAGIRFWEEHPGERPTAHVYLGDPGDPAWLGANRPARLRDKLAISAGVFKTSRTADQVYWLPDANEEQWTGYLAAMLKRVLASKRIKVNGENGGLNHANFTA